LHFLKNKNIFYSVANGAWMFTWSKANYIMSVSGVSLAQIETVVTGLPF